jgi:hypothetical protein
LAGLPVSDYRNSTVTTEVGLCVTLEIDLLGFYGYRASAEQCVNISYVCAEEFYLTDDMRGFTQISLKYNYIGRIWLKITHKP